MQEEKMDQNWRAQIPSQKTQHVLLVYAVFVKTILPF